MTLVRSSFDVYFLRIVGLIAERATCKRLKVGALIVKDNHIISSGYNGSAKGQHHCLDYECDVEDGHCARSIHAEANSLVFAAKYGNAVDGSTIYLTHSPCYSCAKLIVNAGIKRVVFSEDYRHDDRVWKLFNESNIKHDRIVAPPFLIDVIGV